jgi:o-succinylbenzoate synthase
MQFRISVIPHTLHFNFNARTSRGAISEHKAYYLKLWSIYDPTINGVGECAPLKGLSIDFREDLPQKLQDICSMINSNQVNLKFDETLPEELELEEWPSVKFALETALLDLKCGGRRILYRNSFAKGESCISINGLVWMGDKQFMQEQIKCKLEEGFSCLKLKIGSLNFEQELEILQQIRDTASASDLTIRLDANGAFEVNEAIHKLEQLASYQIHSIEQPIKQGQVQQMAELCSHSPIPIALDEELIGIHKVADKEQLLRTIMPQYIILKPTLIGGFQACSEWIELAEKLQIGWWITSALESNIGLNAISQFTGNYKSDLPQGLGTGLLYQNNIDSPLTIDNGKLWFKKHLRWEEPEGLAIF